jgi:PAS domain S-box-containing protein
MQTIRVRLMLLVSAIIIPVLLFVGVLFVVFQKNEQVKMNEAVFDVVRRSSAIIDREIAEMSATLEVLATAPSLLNGDFETFDRQARVVLQTRGRYVSMRDRQGQQIVNTNLPFGTALPIATDPILLANDARVISTGSIGFTDVFIGTTVKRALVSVGVPIRRDGEVAYVLSLTIDPGRLASMMADTAPLDWTVALVDRRDRIIARSREHDLFINKEATESFRANATGESGSYVGITLEGVEVLSGYLRSPVTGWRVAAGAPMTIVKEPLGILTKGLLGLAAVVITLSLVLVVFISRSIARPLQAIATTAGRLGEGEASNKIISSSTTGLVETEAVHTALVQASQKIKDRELSLRDSELRYRQALEVGKIGSWETDFVKQTRRWSQEAMNIFGLSLSGGVGRVGGQDDEWRAALHKEHTNIEDVFNKNLLIKDEYDNEYCIQRPDGTLVFLRGHARVIERDVKGQPSRTINVVADITSSRKAERALYASEAQMKAIIANAPIGIVLADQKGAIYSGNAQAEIMVGHSILHSPNKDSYAEWVSFHADGRRVDSHEYPLARALAGEERPSLNVHYQRPGGSRVWLSLIGSAVRDEANHIVGAVVAILDINVERRATQDLEALNKQLEQRVSQALAERRLLADVMDNTDMFIHIVGLDYRWMAINQAAAEEFARIYGVRPKVGDDMRDLLKTKPEHRAAVEAVWSRALAGEEFIETAEFGDPSLDRRMYEMRTYTLRNSNGQRIGAYQLVTDVTVKLEEQRKVNELQKMDTIGHLTAGVAHDFNNLLSAILSNLDLARKRINDLQIAKLIEAAIKGAERGAVLTSRLLAFARRQELATQAIHFGTLVKGMEELLLHTLGKGIRLEVDIPADMPSVMIDANQLELALLNLAVNARDALLDGCGSVTISAYEHHQGVAGSFGLKPGLYVAILVKDTGYGMDKATLKRAIEPFFTTKGVGKGTGLGLSMVHGLMAQSGGAMHIDSDIGKGTTISLYLPQASATPTNMLPAEYATTPTSITQGKVILVVDDDILVGMGTCAMVEDLGHIVLEAYSGQMALTILDERKDIDIVITDQSMPEMTGVELAEHIRNQRPDIPVILATGYAELPNGQTTDLPRLVKPFRQQDLFDMISKVVTLKDKPSFQNTSNTINKPTME